MTLYRIAKYAIAGQAVDAALTTFPQLCREVPPPSRINVSGSGDEFIANGDGVVENLVRAGLQEGQTVIEPGMGIGGNATALWRRFGSKIHYRGFDVVRFAITWSRQHFRQHTGDYQFAHANIQNSFYNPLGLIRGEKYVFPYADNSADMVFANSVFTHMQDMEVTRYINESARVLKPGGRLWFTTFMMDEASKAQIADRKATYSFRHPSGLAWVEDAKRPNMAVAFPEDWINRALGNAGLRLISVEFSRWRGVVAPSFQDILVAERA